MNYIDPKFFISAPFGNYMTHPNALSVRGTFTYKPNGNRFYSIIKTLRYRRRLRGWTNRLGLPNPGLTAGLNNAFPDDIISIAELERGDFARMHRQIALDQSLELNLSCPNLGKTLPWDNIHVFPNEHRKWCIAKMSPLTSPEEIQYVIESGFKQIHFSNTLPTEYGGLSGPELIPYTESLIGTTRYEFGNDIEIIAGGGVDSESVIHRYMQAGANHISLGSVWFNPFKARRLLSK